MVGRGMQDRIEAAKNEIRNLRHYEKERKRIKEKIKKIEYDEENVRGISYDHQPGTTNPSVISQNRLALIEEKEKRERELLEIDIFIKRIYRWLNKMGKKEREVVEAVLVERKKYREVAKEKNISSTSLLSYYIDRAIEKALEKQ